MLPFTVIAKFLFQDIWRLGIEWDEELPPEFQAIFGKWLTGVKELKKISIPRPYFSMPWSECVTTLELWGCFDQRIWCLRLSKELCIYLGPKAPEWKFICPRSPWWGGWWGRLVRTVKKRGLQGREGCPSNLMILCATGSRS